MNEWIDVLNQFLSPWVYAPILFFVWIIFAFIVKRIVINRLLRMTAITPFPFDDLVVSSLSRPLGVLILGTGVLFLGKLLPLEEKWVSVFTIVFQISLVFALVLFADNFLRGLLNSYSTAIQAAMSPVVLRIILRTALIGTAGLIFLDMIGVSITPLLASLGLGSLSVGLALQETLTSFFSGVYISVDRPIRVGDYVKLDSGEEGYVEEIGWRSTRIRTLPNNMVIVPNQKLTASIVTNYYLPDREIAVLVQVGVHYGSDLEHVERVTIEVARDIMKRVQGAVSNFEPFIRYHTFDSSSINFTVILRGKEYVDQHLIKHEFVKALHARYKKEGIVIPYPLRTIDIPPQTVESLRNLMGK
ncbi:MAG: mechanosensitive ion channel [Candidatus Omnitrophica bacterium]|nr:mechanosensitive ion channel [Candidatus Omnitrophota bacterium]